jgi:hypothetical protein
MADVTDSKSVGGDTVWVQVPLPALQSDNQSDRKGPVWETVQVLFLCRKKSPIRLNAGRLCYPTILSFIAVPIPFNDHEAPWPRFRLRDA